MLKILLALSAFLLAPQFFQPRNDLFQVNHGKSLLDAHNCYPYDGKWVDRIDRALSTGFPVAIEQDIAPYVDPATGKVIAKVTHRNKADAADPTLKHHFFDRVQPIVERALKDGDKGKWPLIVLHFDFKDNATPTLEAVWQVLGEYPDWITTGTKTENDSDLSHLDWKPILVLTEDNDNQEQVFYRKLAPGDKMRLFGSAHTNDKIFQGLNERQKQHAMAHAAPDLLLPKPATNYRRWWNNPWSVVEEGGQRAAGDWTAADDQRLKALADHAHRLDYWIRFYTLDGFAPAQDRGWGAGYNFGSLQAVQLRWKAALQDGVDMIATDQYEDLRAFMKKSGYHSAKE